MTRFMTTALLLICLLTGPALGADVYRYHPKTGEFIIATPAKLDPLETALQGEDVFLVPTNGTLEAPPAAAVGEKAVMQGGSWSVVTDLRGTKYWLSDGSEHEIRNLGETVPADGLLLKPAPTPPTQEEIDEAKIQAEIVSSVRAAAITSLKERGELGLTFTDREVFAR